MWRKTHRKSLISAQKCVNQLFRWDISRVQTTAPKISSYEMLQDTHLIPANDAKFGSPNRSRTVPIPESITPVPGYPRKLVVFRITASKYWQVRV